MHSNLESIYNSGLEIKKNSKSPFGDYQRKNVCQIQNSSFNLKVNRLNLHFLLQKSRNETKEIVSHL